MLTGIVNETMDGNFTADALVRELKDGKVVKETVQDFHRGTTPRAALENAMAAAFKELIGDDIGVPNPEPLPQAAIPVEALRDNEE